MNPESKEKLEMESTGLTGMTPYEEITRHFPIVRGIFDCLPVRDLMTARLIDSSWEKFITDLLHKMEGDLMSPLSSVDLTDIETLRYFLDEFPEGLPPLGLKLFQFSNIKVRSGTPMPELTQFLTTHGQYLKFLTILTHTLSHEEQRPFMESIKFIVTKCPGLETFCIRQGGNEMSQNDGLIEPGSFRNLTGFEIKVKTNPAGIARFLDYDPTKESGKRRIFEGDSITILDFNLIWFKSLIGGDMEEFKAAKFHLRILANGSLSTEDKRILAEGLGKFTKLQELKIWGCLVEENGEDNNNNNDGLRLRLPPTLSTRKLNLNSMLESPIIESQVPNLEQVEIPAWGYDLRRENPFDTGSVFPEVKELKLEMDNEAVTWKLGFPNLETLWMKLPVEALGTLGTFLGQFPTLINLKLIFRSKSSEKSRREAWWNLFTGGIIPVMTHGTIEDVILGKSQPVSQNRTAHLLQVLPNLKRLKMYECPEVIACAVVHLTAMGRMQCLDFLEMETTYPQINSYRETLMGYHRRVIISVQIPVRHPGRGLPVL